MASVSPVPPESDGDNEEAGSASREEGSESEEDAVVKGEIVGGLAGAAEETASTDERDAAGEEEGDAAEITPFFGDEMEQSSELKLLAKGDSLPISWRSDNGTRESEFYEEGEKEKLNPYYAVVRRLSPTELIGRFMKTSSPRVRGAGVWWLLSAYVQIYKSCIISANAALLGSGNFQRADERATCKYLPRVLVTYTNSKYILRTSGGVA